MTQIGLIGGMSWHSTALYYRLLNQMWEQRHGPQVNAQSVVVTLSFAELLQAMQQGKRDWVANRIATAAGQLERAGADCVLLTAFTAHFAADSVRAQTTLSFFDAGTALASHCLQSGFERVGLLGTRLTLNEGHIQRQIESRGVEVLQPTPDSTERLDQIIEDDLTHGNLSHRAGATLDQCVAQLADKGAQAVLLACTELPLLLPRQAPVPLMSGVEVHLSYTLDELEAER